MGMVRARLSADRGTDVRETVFFRFADARIPILSMSYEETTLEKVFLELTGEAPAHVSEAVTAPPAEVPDQPEENEIPAPAAEPDAAPAPEDKPETEDAPKPKKSGKSDNDDYTPLFGG